jgi:hypothetical protein
MADQKRLDELEANQKKKDEFDQLLLDGINHHLQGDRPICWIPLSKAVKLVVETLNVQPGEARELLWREAVPPAVPWVGWKRFPRKEDGPHGAASRDSASSMPVEISLAELREADVNFSFEFVRLPENEEGADTILDLRIELNHLEAWLEKYQAGVAQPVPPVPASKDMAPKNKGGAPRKFDKEAFVQRAARELVRLEGNVRDKRHRLTAIMAEWCLTTWGEEPDTTTLRRWMADIFNPTED